MAANYEIVEKVKQDPLGQARFADFLLREQGQADPAQIVHNPQLSLYALDFERGEALFVETPPEVDLCLAPFYYIAQYEHARRALALPLADMIRLGQDLPVEEEKLVFIYSTGRAGSTLASQVFAQLNGVANLSEPDVLLDLVAYRHDNPQNTAELHALANAVIRLLCQVEAPGGHVIKGRSFAIELGDVLSNLFPAAKNLFLYRDAKSYLISSLRAYDDGVQRSEEELRQLVAGVRAWLKPMLPLLAEVPDDQSLSVVELVSYSWLSPMDSYVKLQDKGVEMLAINYDSWLEAPRETAVAMLEYCAMLPADLAPIYGALDQDSQAGTVLSRESIKDHHTLLDMAHPAELNHVLASHALINTADFIAPNTLRTPSTP